MKKWIEKFERIFTAVAFAEANCHDMAMEVLGHRWGRGKNASLDLFLENVGLRDVRFCYVTAKV